MNIRKEQAQDVLKKYIDLECKLLDRLDGENLYLLNELIDAYCEYRDLIEN